MSYYQIDQLNKKRPQEFKDRGITYTQFIDSLWFFGDQCVSLGLILVHTIPSYNLRVHSLRKNGYFRSVFMIFFIFGCLSCRHHMTPAYAETRWIVDTLRPEQNGHHFADDIFMFFFFDWKLLHLLFIFFKFSFTMVQLTIFHAWFRWRISDTLPDKCLPGCVTSHCVTRSQWVWR